MGRGVPGTDLARLYAADVSGTSLDLEWVVLTTGDRPRELGVAIDSLLDGLGDGVRARVLVVSNGAGSIELPPRSDVELVVAPENLGVPGGRDLGVAHTTAPVVGFLDDDAVAPRGASRRLLDEFSVDRRLAVVSLRLVDDDGRTARRHVPRPRGVDPGRSGEVSLFLGGACAIRRSAYDEVGGYFTELFYGHEELELSWRLVDAGWSIRYLADVEVYHPRTEIDRHADGWRLTGRNRVWVARRTLPWAVAVVHTVSWLVLGVLRTPDCERRRSYAGGWIAGWRGPIDRRPIAWSTVWRLTRLGRPPII